MTVCDLCDQTRECLPKNIEGKQYDICSECWNTLASKLIGKGDTNKVGEPSIADAEKESPRLPGDF